MGSREEDIILKTFFKAQKKQQKKKQQENRTIRRISEVGEKVFSLPQSKSLLPYTKYLKFYNWALK